MTEREFVLQWVSRNSESYYRSNRSVQEAIEVDIERAKQAYAKIVECTAHDDACNDACTAQKHETTQTSVMKLYADLKQKHPDAILLFRNGDFYVSYHDDAMVCSKVLGITLNNEGNIPTAGFPHHALDTYLPKLVRAGYRMAITDLKEDRSNTTKRNIGDLNK